MRKKYLTFIILIAFAFILNIVFLGILVSQPPTQNNVSTIVDDPASKIIVSVIPTYLTPTATNSSSSPRTDKLAITNVQANLTAGSFLVSISNNDSSQIAITNVFVNNYPANLEKDIAVQGNSNIKLLLTLTDGIIFGQTYQIRFLSSEGQSAVYYEIVD